MVAAVRHGVLEPQWEMEEASHGSVSGLHGYEDASISQPLLHNGFKEPAKDSKTQKIMLATLFAIVWFGFTYAVGLSGRGKEATAASDSADIRRLWAQYSPWFAVDEYRPPPSACRITQVNILQRHGARFPTTSAGGRIQNAVRKLQAASAFTDSRLLFLRNYTYNLGTEDLVPFGAAESFSAGEVAFKRYAHLVTPDQLPFVRASGSERVVLSATNWTAGFALASHHVYSPRLSVILSEEGNDTLDDSMCPSAGSSDAQTTQWLNVFYPAVTARLNKAAPGANLTTTDTYNLISLCPFDTAARNGHQSPFCEIFDREEFRGFEYSGDLDKFYNTGYGQELGPVQGVGYINELIARLKRIPVVDHTQTNRTLDGDPATFPLDRAIYADFSHDNQMIAIYAALGLFKQARSLDPLHMDSRPSRTWVASRLVPFGARMVVEKLACGGGEEFVRILVNDAVQPLDFCGGGEVCNLDAFIESQAFARNDGQGDFGKCFQ